MRTKWLYKDRPFAAASLLRVKVLRQRAHAYCASVLCEYLRDARKGVLREQGFDQFVVLHDEHLKRWPTGRLSLLEFGKRLREFVWGRSGCCHGRELLKSEHDHQCQQYLAAT